MAGDLYGKTTQYKGTNLVTADEMVLVVQNADIATEYLVQNVNIQYNQPVTRIFEIGSSWVYFAPGRSIGSFQLGRIIGRYPVTAIFGPAGTGSWTTRVGGAYDKTLTFIRKAVSAERGGAVGPGQTVTGTAVAPLNLVYKITGLIIESYGVATDANGLLVQESVAAQFASLELSSTTVG